MCDSNKHIVRREIRERNDIAAIPSRLKLDVIVACRLQKSLAIKVSRRDIDGTIGFGSSRRFFSPHELIENTAGLCRGISLRNWLNASSSELGLFRTHRLLSWRNMHSGLRSTSSRCLCLTTSGTHKEPECSNSGKHQNKSHDEADHAGTINAKHAQKRRNTQRSRQTGQHAPHH